MANLLKLQYILSLNITLGKTVPVIICSLDTAYIIYIGFFLNQGWKNLFSNSVHTLDLRWLHQDNSELLVV